MFDARRQKDAFSALAKYVETVQFAMKGTARAEDRGRYRDHLAAAAELFEILHRKDWESAKTWTSTEGRAYGTAFLSGDEGTRVETAFASLANALTRP